MYDWRMNSHDLPLHEAIQRAHEDLAEMVSPEDLRLPDGERLTSATYVHIHLPVLAASLQGYGFEDSVRSAEAGALASLSREDRWEWLSEGHRATMRGAAWVRPHLSRSTVDYLEGGTANESPFSHAVSMLPDPRPIIYDGGTDRDGYAVLIRCDQADYIVPMDGLAEGRVGAARRVIGLGSGLTNAGSWNEALVGEPENGVNGRWTTRPMTGSPNGPVMIVGIEWQAQASASEAGLARNAAERHRIIHQTRPDPQPTVSIPYTVPILPQMQGNGIG